MPIRAQGDKNFNFHLKCGRVRIISLLFFDDVLVFYKGNVPSVKAVQDTIYKFSAASSLKANMSKSELYMAGDNFDVTKTISKVQTLLELGQ